MSDSFVTETTQERRLRLAREGDTRIAEWFASAAYAQEELRAQRALRAKERRRAAHAQKKGEPRGFGQF
jgi:hypothetical protein